MGVTLIVQLVSVPVFLAAWGVPTYGEWLVLSAVPTYVALSDLSFSSVAGNSMTMLVAQGKRTDAVTLGRRLWSIVTVMTGIAVLAAVAIALVFGGAFGSGAAIPASEAQIVLVALFLQVAVGNQYGVLDAWYRAGGRYPLSATLRQLGRLLEFGALMGAVLLGAGPGTAAMAFLVGSAVGFGVSWVVLRRAVPWSTFRPERPHLQTFRELLAPGVAFMAFPIGNALGRRPGGRVHLCRPEIAARRGKAGRGRLGAIRVLGALLQAHHRPSGGHIAACCMSSDCRTEQCWRGSAKTRSATGIGQSGSLYG